MRQRNRPPGSALMISRLSLRKGYSGETSSESFSKSSLLRMMTFATSKTPGTQLTSFRRRLSSVLAFAANAAYCFSLSIFTSHFLNEISRCGSAGGWGAPQDAFGYPNAMLAKPVTGWQRKNAADLEAAILIRFLDFGKAVKGGADEISLFSGSNFSRHTVADFIPAHHQHTASAQLLAGDAVEIPLFIGVVLLEVLRFTQLRADGDVSEFVNLAAVAFEQAGRGVGSRANVGECFFHDDFPFLYIYLIKWQRQVGCPCGRPACRLIFCWSSTGTTNGLSDGFFRFGVGFQSETHPVGTQFVVGVGDLNAHSFISFQLGGENGGPGPAERIEDATARHADFHQIPHEL